MWSHPPKTLKLAHDEIHVWRASLELTTAHITSLYASLSPDEQARANRFRFNKLREHFVAARGLLRAILSQYLHVSPGQLEFRYNPHGKPSLIPSEKYTVNFNLSHSEGLALYAVSYAESIGIDLELVRPISDMEQLVERFFSSQERTMFRALPPNQKLAAFFTCWTRKEAYLKARGEGLTLPLDQFDVSLIPGEPATLLSDRTTPLNISPWSLQDLHPGPEYVAALAAQGDNWRLKYWQWPKTR
ncbi:MAG: 4'-phosphopantetheinyl transferase superfamily protein [Chloroflexi bacterium]|nr:4'-phosphopantetheinyl transferase superfamily protein [Chloroflexota bacterium]